MADPESRMLLAEFLGCQSMDLRDWWARLRVLDPKLATVIGQEPVFDDAEYRRRGRDPRRPNYEICNVQDSRDEEPGVWVQEARRKDRLAEFVVARYYGIHQPLLPGLAILLARAVDASDRRLAHLVRTVAAASQNLEAAERLVGVELGTAYAVAGHRPRWAAASAEDVGVFAVADSELFERREPYLFLVRLVDGLVESDPGWQRVADLTARSKAA